MTALGMHDDQPVAKQGLPIHDATVDALTPAPVRGASSDGMPLWALLVLAGIAVFCALTILGVIL